MRVKKSTARLMAAKAFIIGATLGVGAGLLIQAYREGRLT